MSIGCKMRGLGESTYYTKSLKPQLDEIAGSNPYTLEHEVGKRRLRIKIDADADVIENITNTANQKAPKSNSVSMEWYNGLPMTYNNVEYLACNSGQYIDTKIKATGTMRFELDAEAISWNYTNYLIGGINMKNNIIISMNYNNGFGTAGAVRYGSQFTFLSSNFHSLSTKYSYIFDCGKFYRNNTLVKSFEKEDFKSSYNTLLFAAYHDNYGLHNLGGKKVWYLNMYENGHNILKFVPALDPTGAPCMFDLVSRRPFYNSGSGDFLYPTPSTTYSLRRYTPEYAIQTPTGIRKLYHVPENYDGSIEDYAKENNYKRLVEPECPNEEGKFYESKWKETDEELILEWVEVEPPVLEEQTPIEEI